MLSKLLPLTRRKEPKAVLDRLDFLLDSQHWDAGRLQEYQRQKLTGLLTYAYERVPYYQRVFEAAGLDGGALTTPEAFGRVPLLTKAAIRDHFEELVSKDADRNDLFLNSTGGSTGEPLNFYQDADYLHWEKAAAIRAWKYFPGFEKDELEGLLWGAERDIGKGLTLKRVAYGVLREGALPLNTFDIEPRMMRSWIRYFNLLEPAILRGYASSLFYFAKHVAATGERVHAPAAIISSAEMLWPEMRKTVETALGAPVFDSYGSREVSQIATECSAHDGLHIVAENQYVELVGTSIVVTNLNNRAMPLIRYRIGDVAEEIRERRCSCGRQSPRLFGLKGRESDVITLPSGRVIHGEYFTHLFYGTSGVERFQVDYDQRNHRIAIRCSNLSASDAGRFKEQIKKDLGLEDVEFRELEREGKTVTGKYRFINVIRG